ncbi:MAG: aldehyde dehydrogenase family protein [Candidatus Omnitrophota bacterium]|nr:aldehyde dehydrogenase family protein [Candidatus Omnitrophota bacterium]
MSRKVYSNFIAGKWSQAEGKGKFENRNPADFRDVIGVFPLSTTVEVDKAVHAAAKAYDGWRLTPAPKRASIIAKTGELLLKHKEELARLMTREMGKVLKETRGDVQEGVDMAAYVAGEGRRLLGETTTSELKNKLAMTLRMPIGVCGMITPWNFPIAIPTWKIFPALICGNTVVFKPAEDTPASAVRFVEILEQAGLPTGVVNLIHGGPAAGQALVRHPEVRVVSFTGSCEVGREVASNCGRMLKRCSLEMGGKNAQIVMGDADLDLALEGALWGAFGTTGQRCTATSRIYLHHKIYASFVKSFVRQAKKIRVGNGLRSNVQMGPLINEAQRNRVHEYVKIGVGEGAKLECGGRIAKGPGLKNGFFYVPTVFTHAHSEMRIIREEIFGPVVSLMKVKSLDEAVTEVNKSAYGLSSSIYSNDIANAMKAVRDIEAGITYVNGPTIGAEVHLPFGGVKNTGNGHREAGKTALDIFSEWKSVYIDFSGKLQKAQIDTD